MGRPVWAAVSVTLMVRLKCHGLIEIAADTNRCEHQPIGTGRSFTQQYAAWKNEHTQSDVSCMEAVTSHLLSLTLVAPDFALLSDFSTKHASSTT